MLPQHQLYFLQLYQEYLLIHPFPVALPELPLQLPVKLPTNPPAVAKPATFIPPAPVTATPTGTSAPNVNLGAPVPALFVKLPALILVQLILLLLQ